ncbi:MAG: YdcF family protein [Balneolaceae bacterium]
MKSFKNLICLLSFFSIVFFAGCDGNNRNVDQDNESTNAIIVKKAFPLFSEIRNNSSVLKRLKNHEALKAISKQQLQRVNTALSDCDDVPCLASATQWTDNEIAEIGDHLSALYNEEGSLEELVAELKEQDSYIMFEDADDQEFIREVWEHAATGVNHVIDVYFKGEKPRYPKIDSISFKVNHAGFINLVHTEMDTLVQEHPEDAAFFELPLKSALKALEINNRDEAARYEPLNEGYNKEPYERVSSLDWNDYDYSLIIVPGQGPPEPGIILDSLGIYKMELAMERYRNGLAPYLVVSGGNVHPYKTPYNEAVEMKKYLMREFDVPDEDIFIDPHARHTTTNIRNASRLILRYGMPADKPVLIVTDSGQNGYINGRMGRRGLNELGYHFYKDLEKLSDNESKFFPVDSTLQADPFDILDP